MDCYRFNQLKAQEKIDYIYNNCRLVDFEVIHEKYREYGICLYHNGQIFIEISFDGVRGDRIKEIKAYAKVSQISHWYEHVNIRPLLSEQI